MENFDVIKSLVANADSINEQLARDRAEEVKKILIKKYKIDSSRITARGMGVSDSFSEPDWNRVCILTVMEE